MLFLIGAAIASSVVASLNPTAIGQQKFLQAAVKNKRHTLYFIWGIGLANVALGLAVYYGIVNWVSQLLETLTARFPLPMYGGETVLGLACLILGIYLTIKTHRANAASCGEDFDHAKAPAQLTPASLFIMGAGFCFLELTRALPYFAFLALLATYELMFPIVLAFIILYSFIYAFPLIIVYAAYNKLQGTVLIRKIESILSKVSAYIVPAVVGLLGAYMMVCGLIALL